MQTSGIKNPRKSEGGISRGAKDSQKEEVKKDKRRAGRKRSKSNTENRENRKRVGRGKITTNKEERTRR